MLIVIRTSLELFFFSFFFLGGGGGVLSLFFLLLHLKDSFFLSDFLSDASLSLGLQICAKPTSLLGKLKILNQQIKKGGGDNQYQIYKGNDHQKLE